MLPLYAARIEDLGLGDFVKVDCAACHGPWRPLTVAQRLTLQHQLARAEFLARIGLRVSP